MAFDVVVIGAGVAGLSAATAAAEAGARVLVVEARPGGGGRASTFRDPETGELVDNGQHILMGCYDETFRFLRRIGTAGCVRRQPGLSVEMIDRAGRLTTFSLPPLPSPVHLVAGVFAWEALTWRECLSVLRLAPALRPAPDGGQETVHEWLVRHGQAPRLSELLWEPLALAAMNQSIHEAAAPLFVEVLRRMLGPDPDAATLVIPACPLDALYVAPALRWLREQGGDVRMRASATLEVHGDRATGVRVGSEAIPADVVISTVPWFALTRLLREPVPALDTIVRDASALGSSPIVTVNLWFDRPVLDTSLLGLPGRTFQWVFDKGSIFGEGTSHLSLVSSGAERVVRQSNDELIRTAMDEVTGALPAARAARLRKASAVRERHSTFSLAPGQPPRPGTRTPLAGLLLAGDWIETGLPATIESAAASGHRAAEMAARE